MNKRTNLLVCAAITAATSFASAQQRLPDAPALHLLASAGQGPAQIPAAGASAQNQNGAQQPPATGNPNAIQVGALNSGPTLTIDQAEQMAMHNNPNISVAQLLAMAQQQIVRETRSSELPNLHGDLTAVDSHINTRVTAGYLSNSSIYNRAAGGLSISQLITDFGRTRNLVKSSQSTARAQLESEKATELDIKLAVDQAFYRALTTQGVLKVAEQTVAQRQATGDQVNALTQSNVKSQLDLSFANVQVSQANLLLLDAKGSDQAAMAALNAVLGSEQDQQFTLVDQSDGNMPPAPTDADALVQSAFNQRPDLASLNDRVLAARQYTMAERDLWMPSVSALAVGGGTPVRSDQILSPWYGAAGANVDIPIFNGFLYNADTKEARLRAQAAQEQVRDLRDTIARDVRTAVLTAQTAFQRIGVTQGELDQANLALDLAQARYKIGLSSIVELTQAQLAQTQAQIDNTTARYDYQTALSEVRYETGQ